MRPYWARAKLRSAPNYIVGCGALAAREIDVAIAAVAILRDASLRTLNAADFAGIPNLRLAPRGGPSKSSPPATESLFPL
jgi:predicted nucleic acid-binding protein